MYDRGNNYRCRLRMKKILMDFKNPKMASLAFLTFTTGNDGADIGDLHVAK